jgi:serine/threonine protein phosphatase 1
MTSIFSRFRRTAGQVSDIFRLPTGLRVYAVGDVHGRRDCLRQIESRIVSHRASAPRMDEDIVIFLGDYIDRGPASRDVIAHLLDGMFAGMPARLLRGNHEEAMLRFLDDPLGTADWLAFGGLATLASYGVSMPGAPTRARLLTVRDDLAARVPDTHRDFLHALELWIEIGGFLFVHAGIRPGVALARQRRADLLEIREPFLSHAGAHRWRVVHGHSVTDAAVISPVRIGVDTGAYATGRLSCAVICDDQVTILSSI